MRRLLLDTTFLIDRERRRPDAGVLRDEDDVAMAAITVAELQVGVELADDRWRPSREAFVRSVLLTVPSIEYDARVAAQHARLLAVVRRAGRPRGAHDLMIAATALETNRSVLTADVDGFADLPGVDVIASPRGGAADGGQ